MKRKQSHTNTFWELRMSSGENVEKVEKVEKMSAELEIAKVKVAEFKKQCEEYLVTLVQQKKSADEQQKQVSATREKISQEEIKCKAIADNAQRDLDEATPALEAALAALESLNKKDIRFYKLVYKLPLI